MYFPSQSGASAGTAQRAAGGAEAVGRGSWRTGPQLCSPSRSPIAPYVAARVTPIRLQEGTPKHRGRHSRRVRAAPSVRGKGRSRHGSGHRVGRAEDARGDGHPDILAVRADQQPSQTSTRPSRLSGNGTPARRASVGAMSTVATRSSDRPAFTPAPMNTIGTRRS